MTANANEEDQKAQRALKMALSSELASVMEFGFNPSELLTVAQHARTGDDLPVCES